ncbi:putative monooxygenase [Hypomontagnella monticulosa]|nr:putative monooxygenase [Hypomontagnella monticulosa]
MAESQNPVKTGIKVIVVGTGFAGLTAAIECHRKGHSVLVLEKFPELKLLGDIISFGPNSSRLFRRWPGVAEKLEPLSMRADSITMKSWKGDTLFTQYWEGEDKEFGIRYDGHRGEFHEIVYNHAKEIGVEIRLNARVEDYFEDDKEAGVILENGERLTADVIVAAEGVRSKGRKIVLGFEDAPKPSGYAVYRSWFSADEIAKDPDTKFFTEGGDQHIAWLGPDVHFIAACMKKGKDFSWVCTHKDEADIEESWQLEAPLADARKVLEGWDPIVQKILDKTPEPLIDWKLVYRDPLPTWISKGRRIALIGDSAHPFLPTSIQGASQAMEDGVTIAVCLRECGSRDKVQEAVAAFEAIRYDRVKSAQKTGEQTRDIWHKADFTAAKKNPESMRLRREAWILGFDAEKYAEDNYARTVEVLRRTGLHDTSEARKLHIPESTDGYLEYKNATTSVDKTDISTAAHAVAGTVIT